MIFYNNANHAVLGCDRYQVQLKTVRWVLFCCAKIVSFLFVGVAPADEKLLFNTETSHFLSIKLTKMYCNT